MISEAASGVKEGGWPVRLQTGAGTDEGVDCCVTLIARMLCLLAEAYFCSRILGVRRQELAVERGRRLIQVEACTTHTA
jgi:hypothetical protein